EEGKIVGIPRYPVSTAIATTNLGDRLVNLVSSTFAKLGPPWGMAEGNPGMPISAAVVSGYDWRRPGPPGEVNYINQLIVGGGSGGGPGVDGHDGWLSYGIPVTGGVIYVDSVELNEQRFPLIYKEFGILKDSGGSGKYDGAPSGLCIYGTRKYPMVVAWVSDGTRFPPKGVLGGEPGHRTVAAKITAEGEKMELLGMGIETLQPGEYIYSIMAGGGGYDDPLERDPERVRISVRDNWVSLEKAREVYGVVLKNVEDPETLEVDYEATKRLREELKRKRDQNGL
ncbi:MAG: hydantoinase B/oxoprolinase family protein, partial [Candidatus Lokiarchaeia archaeon]